MPNNMIVEPINLPTIAEIEAATDVLSMSDNAAKDVRVKEHFAAENMTFLATNSQVPVPKVYTAFVALETSQTYIIMEYIHDQNPLISGPFASQEGINRGILGRLRYAESPEYVQLVQTMVDRTLHGHRTVFAHGDLQPKNIMVQELNSHENGNFCNATMCCRFKPDWLALIPVILKGCLMKCLMMQVVYSTIFY
ncbi:hypothetical protein BDV26DRAFT_279592 [Aspergillus bertholletiae]|uniref:Aminoglycoside phosphotransferase domain-containing protein n=1 Tax=Aspergillus bertholletiae TaxID=1226010 RepID=A0A5N7BF18_9EURO|nr:hypothetical protein BDV26DRAFT_279592 [Aspergillus bertholletiae]